LTEGFGIYLIKRRTFSKYFLPQARSYSATTRYIADYGTNNVVERMFKEKIISCYMGENNHMTVEEIMIMLTSSSGDVIAVVKMMVNIKPISKIQTWIREGRAVSLMVIATLGIPIENQPHETMPPQVLS
jgi:hypothetical protein